MSERKSVFVDFKGLVTSPGTMARPKGSFSSVINFELDDEGVVRKRVGYKSSCYNGVAGTNYVANQYVHKVMRLSNESTFLLSTSASTSAGSAFSIYSHIFGAGNLGTLSTPTKEPSALVTTTDNQRESYLGWNYQAKMQSAKLGLSTYLTAQNTKGQFRVEVDGTSYYVRPAGVPKGLGFAREHYAGGAIDVGCTLNPAPATSWLVNGTSVAYRYVIAYVNEDKSEKLGAPSSRFVIYNRAGETGHTGAITSPVLKMVVPWATCTGNLPIAEANNRVKLLIYRTNMAPSGTLPNEEYFLCYEGFLTIAELAAPYITVTDTRAQSLLGESLYTNGSQAGASSDFGVGGLVNANEIPPQAVCLEQWDNRVWYGQTRTYERLEVQLVDQFVAADTITVNGVVYTATAVGALAATTDFSVGPYVATLDALEYQANSLCTAINRNSANTSIYAYYIGTGSGLFGGATAPGRIMLEKRTFPTSVLGGFQVTASAPAKINPTYTAGSSLKAYARWGENDLWFSKDGNGDAVPFTNLLTIGDGQCTIIGMKSLEEGLYVFTTAGLYVVSGRNGSYKAQLVDPTCIPLGRELFCVTDQSIYAWTMQGVCVIKGGGVSYVSQPIKDKLLKEIVTYYGVDSGAINLDRLKAYSFMVADSVRHRVYLWLPYNGTWDESKYATRAYVYGTRTGKWSYIQTTSNGSKDNNDVSSGCEIFGTSQSALSEWNSNEAALLFPMNGTADADYSDFYGTSTTARAFTSSLTLNFEAPEFESKVFWDELHILWEFNQTFTDIASPATISLTFAGDFTDATATITITPTPSGGVRYSRVKVPREVRSSARLSLTLSNSVASEAYGIEGLVLFYSGGSKETVRT